MNFENMIQSNSSKELNLCHQFSDKMSTNGSFFIPEIKKSRSCDDLQIGDRIYVNGVKPGTIRFLGETSFSSGIWSGIELDDATGKNDGSVNGIKYFSCQPSYGIFVRPHRLTFEPLGNGENLVPSTVASSVNGDTVNSRCTPTTIHSSLSNRPILSSNGNNINNNTTTKSKSSKSVSSEKWKQSVLRALDSSGLTKGHHNKHHHSDRKKDTRTTLDQRLTSLENEVRQLRSEKTKLADMLVDQLTAVKEDNGDLSDQVVSLQIDNIALHMRIDELNKLWTCNKLLIKTLELVIDEWRKDVQSKDLGNQALRDALEKIYLDRLNFCKLRLNRIN